MIGPQYPLALHRKLVAGVLTDNPGSPPNSIAPGLLKMLQGIALLGINQVVNMYFPASFMEESEFFQYSFWGRMGYIIISGNWFMYKVCLASFGYGYQY